jgi:2-oxoglutarate dehydrogenase E2 component (dihydrolipoamide succinyltransferase)
VSVEVKVPRLAESISEAVLAEWLKADGAPVRADEPIATLETDKAAVEIAASDAGVLRQARKAGDTVQVGDVLARIEPASGATKPNGAGERGRVAARREAARLPPLRHPRRRHPRAPREAAPAASSAAAARHGALRRRPWSPRR